MKPLVNHSCCGRQPHQVSSRDISRLPANHERTHRLPPLTAGGSHELEQPIRTLKPHEQAEPSTATMSRSSLPSGMIATAV